jgi:adenylate kinase family enzyme
MQRIEKNSLIRINVVGTSGSGKTTFSKMLASRLNFPRIEMDQVFWGPNWHQTPDDIFFKKVEEALSNENWVLDGNYTRTTPVKWQKVTAVIWLDYSYPRILYQAFRRSVKYILTGKEIWPNTGNIQTVRMTFFSKDSILLWTITHLRQVKRKYELLSKDTRFSHIYFYRLKSPKEAQEFLNGIN